MSDYEQRITNLLKVAELMLQMGDAEEAQRWINTAKAAMEHRTP